MLPRFPYNLSGSLVDGRGWGSKEKLSSRTETLPVREREPATLYLDRMRLRGYAHAGVKLLAIRKEGNFERVEFPRG